jgi:hypothetical protein
VYVFRMRKDLVSRHSFVRTRKPTYVDLVFLEKI